MQSLGRLRFFATANASLRFFGLSKPKRKTSRQTSARARGSRKSLRIERPGFRDKFRKGEAPIREALLTLTAFFAIIAFYGAVIGGGGEKVTAGLHGLFASASRSLGFGIREVRVAGGSRFTGGEIAELLDIKSASALTFDVNAARKRFLEVPWVKSASVRLLLPGTVEVSVVERAPYALWQKNGIVNMIDRDGRRIGAYNDSRFSSLPLVVGAGADSQATSLLEELARYPALQSRTRAAIYVANRRWNLKLTDGVDVKLPERNFDAALAMLAKLDRENALLNRDITIVDLRLPDRVIVRLSEGAAKQRLDTLKSRFNGLKKLDPVAAPKPEGGRA